MCVTSLQCDYVEAKANALDVKRISKREAMTDILVGSGIAAETALGWVLNALGFTAASKAVYDSRDNLVYWVDGIRDDLLQVAKERYKDLEISADSFEQWLQQVADGTLDKSSDCWRALKRYLTEAKTGSVAAEDSYETIQADGLADFLEKEANNNLKGFDNVSKYVNASDYDYVSLRTFDYVESNKFLEDDGKWFEKHETTSTKMYATKTSAQDKENIEYAIVKFVFERDDGDYDIFSVSVNPTYEDNNKLPFLLGRYSFNNNVEQRFSLGSFNKLKFCGHLYEGLYGVGYAYAGISGITVMINKASDILNGYEQILLPMAACGLLTDFDGWDVKVKNPTNIGGVAKEVADSIAVAPETQEILDRDKALDNVDVVSGLDIPADVAIPTDLTGVKVGDLAIPYTDAVPNVETVDTVKDITLPDKIPTNEKVKTKPKNKTGEFTLSGLEQVFPFCIPWDVKNLYGSLTAEAQAPKFTWKFFYMNNGKMVSKNIEIDLSKFDTVAKYVRTMELLAFMLFITLKTRDLIRG